ncbi:MAG TPA: L-2-hydroxyglutarate oxidase [Thermoanaerobaculia bacterium]
MNVIAVIGGGIVGLATACELTRHNQRVVLLEKESELAFHQTGHNSGVIHSGVYYKPGSAKARTCTRGGALLRRFCDEHGVVYSECGKVIVARTQGELPMLEELHRRGVANGVSGVELVGPDRLREIEPHAAGLAALHVPTAAIIDYREVCRVLARKIIAAGGEIRTLSRVTRIHERENEVVLETTSGDLHCERYIACAGLQADRVAGFGVRSSGFAKFKIVPFRGEYYEVKRTDLVRGLIYPVPDPRFPFLGVHFTRSIHGGLEAGPNAVLALAREGYRKRDVNLRDLAETLTYSGFWHLIAKYWRVAAGEVRRSLSKRAFARALQSLVPEITPEDLVPAPAGVRAQALAPDGFLHDDFLLVSGKRSLHVCNAPSPAATASLAIAQEIVAALRPV